MTTRNLTDGDLKRMAEQGFKPKGWSRYKDSPYKEYKNIMESIGYEKKKNSDNARYYRQDS